MGGMVMCAKRVECDARGAQDSARPVFFILSLEVREQPRHLGKRSSAPSTVSSLLQVDSRSGVRFEQACLVAESLIQMS